MNKNERIIWDNFDLNEDDWKDAYQEWLEMNGYDEDNAPMSLCEYMYYTNDTYLEDERANLNKDVDGVIMCLVDVGTWHGRYNGLGVEGTNIRDILYSNFGFGLSKWYCDRWNVRGVQAHHDGRNYLLYRVVESKEKAEWLKEMLLRGKMDEKKFMRHTKSLRPYIAKVYGW